MAQLTLSLRRYYNVQLLETSCRAIHFAMEEVATAIVSLTNRPWDAMHPLFDWMVDFPDFRARIFGTKEPISLNVTFRNLRREPFTPNEFIEEGILDLFSFGLLAFMARHRASLLFTGPKGSGKTSLLSTMLLTIPDRSILVIEDTPEIPVDTLRDSGFDVTRYKVASPLFVEQETYERNVREVVYVSLRAGPRVVVIGELRGALISNLFEMILSLLSQHGNELHSQKQLNLERYYW